MAKPDWKLLETFVRVAEKGSLSAATGALGVSQPTVSRLVQALETELGAKLFVRHSRGLTLTDRGVELFAAARLVDDGVQAVFRRAAGLREVPRGTVRVSVNEPLGVYVLPRCFAKLRQDYPEVKLEVVIENGVANLSRRDADVAVRMFRPEQVALVARRVGTVTLGLFAAQSYVQRHGVPEGAADVAQHTLIGSDRDPSWARAVTSLGLSPSTFAFRSDSLVAQIEAVLHGVGIGALHLSIAARHPSLVRVLPRLPIPKVETWLVMHEDLRGNAGVRAVFDALFRFLQKSSV